MVFPGRRSSQCKNWAYEDYNTSSNLKMCAAEVLSASGEMAKSEAGEESRSRDCMAMT